MRKFHFLYSDALLKSRQNDDVTVARIPRTWQHFANWFGEKFLYVRTHSFLGRQFPIETREKVFEGKERRVKTLNNYFFVVTNDTTKKSQMKWVRDLFRYENFIIIPIIKTKIKKTKNLNFFMSMFLIFNCRY